MRRAAALLALLLMGGACVPPAHAALDPTFGAGGSAAGPLLSADAVAVRPGGGVVVGGRAYDRRGGPVAAVAGFTAGGVLDPGFGRDGMVSVRGVDGLAGVAAVPSGGVVAAGYRTRAGRREPALVRLDARGDVVGVSGAPLGEGDALPAAVAVAPDGSVLVACDAVRAGEAVIAIERLGGGSAGSVGFVALPGRALTAAGVAVGGDGRVTVAGTAYDPMSASSDPLVARLLPSGRPDLGFGGGAPVVVPTDLRGVRARALALGRDGSTVVAGSGRAPLRSEFVAVRLTPAGAVDPAFGSGGVAAVPVGDGDAYATGVAVDRSGGMVLSGSATASAVAEPALVRLGPEGLLVAGSAAVGALSPSVLTGSRPAALALDPAGRPVVAGSAFAGGLRQATLSRYAAGG